MYSIYLPQIRRKSKLCQLDLFNADLFQKMCWRGPRSQEVGDEGDYTYYYTVTNRVISALRWAAVQAFLFGRQ